MHPPYLALSTSSNRTYDAAESQAELPKTRSYQLNTSSRRFGSGSPQGTDPQNARRIRMLSGVPRVDKTYRRLTCLRASKAFALFPCWPSWQHAAATTLVTLKNSWSLTQFQLPLSQRSTANTTKVVERFSGQASAPAPHRHHQPHQHFDKEAA